ncbi:MAG TPA: isochorismatase family protein [Sedimentisphaerales bacterium]|nr:isochorismatase family protein [Sedimentisphaerales bacterium]
MQRESVNGKSQITVMGLATDYCVKFTILDTVKLGFKTTLLLKGCRGVELNPGDRKKAIEEMKQVGVVIQED